MAAALCGCERPRPQPAATVFAAASTTDAVSEVAGLFRKQTGAAVELNFAASSTLAQQIEAGAACDIFISASREWVDRLEQRGMLTAGTRRDLFSNRLVFIVPHAGQAQPGEGMPHPGIVVEPGFDIAAAFHGRLALADPEHVPAGKYTQQALEQLGWWGALRERLAPALDVRAALKLVEAGECELGIVYATDAAGSRRVQVVAEVPLALHDPIAYPAALCRNARPAAAAFFEFLTSDAAAAVFERHGFVRLRR